MAAANSSGGVLGKMISPQNLAIGAAAVGMAGQEGDLFRRVLGWSLVLVAAHVRARLPPVHPGPRLDGRGVSAGAGPAYGEGPPPNDDAEPTPWTWARSGGVASALGPST